MIAIVMFSIPTLRFIGNLLGVEEVALDVWEVDRWPVFAAALVAVIVTLFRGTGNVRPPRFQWLALGALFALILLGAASLGFGFYASNFARYNETFGTFAVVTIFLVWLFLVNAALLLGVELNAEIERGRELQAGVQAEVSIPVTVRDTSVIERSERVQAITHEHGRMLRRGDPLPPRPDSFLLRVKEWFRHRQAAVTSRSRDEGRVRFTGPSTEPQRMARISHRSPLCLWSSANSVPHTPDMTHNPGDVSAHPNG